MNKGISFWQFCFVLVTILFTCSPPALGQISSSSFEFQFEGKTLRGLIEKSENQPPQALVIIVPGHGKTNFVEGNWYAKLRNQLVSAGLTVCFWNKMGCGRSDGVYNHLQPVTNSASEVLAAIQQIKQLNIEGSNKIGLWGISRAGWICPLVNAEYPVDFWISVSGTDDKENFGYLVKSNLKIAGKPEDEVEKLFNAWMSGHRIFCTNGSYQDFLAAIDPLMQDSLSRALFGYQRVTEITAEGNKNFIAEQSLYTSTGHFDEASGLWVCLNDFPSTLEKISCPVLALFGENDAQVDWVKTRDLYASTIGKSNPDLLTMHTFTNCNHNLQRCKTCAYKEDLSSSGWEACDGYYQSMKDWLKAIGIID